MTRLKKLFLTFLLGQGMLIPVVVAAVKWGTYERHIAIGYLVVWAMGTYCIWRGEWVAHWRPWAWVISVILAVVVGGFLMFALVYNLQRR